MSACVNECVLQALRIMLRHCLEECQLMNINERARLA